MKYHINDRRQLIDFMFCKKCACFVHLNEYEIEEDVKCRYCNSDENIIS